MTHFESYPDVSAIVPAIVDANPNRVQNMPGHTHITGFNQPREAAQFEAVGSTIFGMVTDDATVYLARPGIATSTAVRLLAGSYFVVNGRQFPWLHVAGKGLLIRLFDYFGLTQFGGPVEEKGRLEYIDGCSDSLLVCPPVLGEPCLNHLHIPAGTNQTQHVHPSDRIGIIIRGSGECRTPDGVHALAPGMFWRIPTGGVHSFHTGPNESLDVFAWHPESDFGPRPDFHPMLNRTIVEGKPAYDVPAIRSTSDDILPSR